mmetsp:Transcript_57183/g.165702  ORF Transcript_57183/g.165702 Transcript_57183/m.165702 type:complete len:216 (-) Transcript_57183:722-1369(-)
MGALRGLGLLRRFADRARSGGADAAEGGSGVPGGRVNARRTAAIVAASANAGLRRGVHRGPGCDVPAFARPHRAGAGLRRHRALLTRVSGRGGDGYRVPQLLLVVHPAHARHPRLKPRRKDAIVASTCRRRIAVAQIDMQLPRHGAIGESDLGLRCAVVVVLGVPAAEVRRSRLRRQPRAATGDPVAAPRVEQLKLRAVAGGSAGHAADDVRRSA